MPFVSASFDCDRIRAIHCFHSSAPSVFASAERQAVQCGAKVNQRLFGRSLENDRRVAHQDQFPALFASALCLNDIRARFEFAVVAN